jgi:heat shock protein HtpX
MAAYGLYTHIRSNRRRSIALLIGLFFLVFVMTFAGALIAEAFLDNRASFDEIVGRAWRDLIGSAPFVAIGTAVWILIAYRFHQAMIDALTGGHEVTRTEQPRLYNLLENLCISRGIPMPKLKIMDSAALNAFASGLNQKQYSITVTSGLVDRLTDAELEAVLAHELTHIRNDDVRMMVIAVIIAGVVSFAAEIFFRVMFRGGMRMGGGGSSGSSDRKGGAGAAILLAIVLIAVAWFLSLVIRFALSRSREFLADAGAVELTKNPDAMIMALRKIENRGELNGVTSAVMEMCVDNPRSGFEDMFATHPSIESRVDALVRMAGGRDPGPLEALPEPGTADEPVANDSQHSGEPQQGPWSGPPASNSGSGGATTIGPWGPVRS